jgi:pimeloyl-ACP methyl ester carboxylesterase
VAGELTCVVSIHGIGFQSAPGTAETGWPDGYADHLHELLYAELAKQGIALSDDPGRNTERAERFNNKPGTAGPIYVQSSWTPVPPITDPKEQGLSRLGIWKLNTATLQKEVDMEKAPPMVQGDARIAHIAVVYSDLEEKRPLPGSAMETVTRSALSLSHYSSVTDLVRAAVRDFGPILHHAFGHGKEPNSLRVRRDPQAKVVNLQSPQVPERPATQPPKADNAFTILRTLEDDVAAYVCRNDLRERVRSFVRDALLLLANRTDVGTIIINSHSNGTVIAFDVLREFPHSWASKIKTLVTLGSPLRKYADLFFWGTDVGSLKFTERWINIFDEADPVADPLRPPATWRLHEDWRGPFSESLYQWSSDAGPQTVTDELVNNVENSPDGSLRAHNYWDNEAEVVPRLAALVRVEVPAAV